jgi:hypothetical protein
VTNPLDEAAERAANSLEAKIDSICPVPKNVECRECSGKGFWSRDGDVVFCYKCEAGKSRRSRQGVLNRMLHGSYLLAQRLERERQNGD